MSDNSNSFFSQAEIKAATVDPGPATDAFFTRVGCHYLAIGMVTPQTPLEAQTGLIYKLDAEESLKVRELFQAALGELKLQMPEGPLTSVALIASPDQGLLGCTVLFGSDRGSLGDLSQQSNYRQLLMRLQPGTWKNFADRAVAGGLVLAEDILYDFPITLHRLDGVMLILSLAPQQ